MKHVIENMGEIIVILAFGFMILRFFVWLGTQVLL